MIRDYYISGAWAHDRVRATVRADVARTITDTFRTFHSWERLMQDTGKPSKRKVKSEAHKRGGLLHGKVKDSCMVIPAGTLPANGRSRTIARYGADGRLVKKVRVYRGPRNVKRKDPFHGVRSKERTFTKDHTAIRQDMGLSAVIDGSVFLNTYVTKAKLAATLPKENLSQWGLR